MSNKTRTEFVKEYAARSGLDAPYAEIGLLEMGGCHARIALPCECGRDGCEGWVMVSADGVLDHLELYAPEPLRRAYVEALNKGKPDVT